MYFYFSNINKKQVAAILQLPAFQFKLKHKRYCVSIQISSI